jgi:hypothetical protein
MREELDPIDYLFICLGIIVFIAFVIWGFTDFESFKQFLNNGALLSGLNGLPSL